MSGLRGPDSSRDAQLLDNAVFPETVDVNIRQLDPIPAPRYFLKEIPLTDEMSGLVLKSRQEIRDVLNGKDDRLLAIVGPCSIHDPKAAHEYAEKLAAVKKELEDRLVIVMRVYFEKPRTTIGWKGLINDPDIDGSCNIKKGLLLARRTLLGVLDAGLAAATEFLEPTSPQYISDAVSWGAVGARNTESQVHRQLASGMSMPIGFKNATDGSIKAPTDSCFASAQQHTFFGVDHMGRAAVVKTLGNPDCHVVGKGSPLLAALVDRGDFNQHDINTEIRTQVDNILAREKVENLILGCTHYPIVEENFHECYPEMHLINPALEQANAVKAYLTEQNALNPQKKGKFVICTSGDPQVYVNVGKRLGLFEASELKVVHI